METPLYIPPFFQKGHNAYCLYYSNAPLMDPVALKQKRNFILVF